MRYRLVTALLLFAAALSANVKKESLHYLTTELGVGYSALLNKTDYGSSSGMAGGKLQVGYEWRYRKLLVHTGLEFAMMTDQAKVSPFTLETPYTIGLPAGQNMVQHFSFEKYRETLLMGQVNIPIQVGAVFNNRYYFLAGARIGLPLMHSSTAKSPVRTWLTDPALIGSIGEVPVHDAFTSDEKVSHKWNAALINAQVSAEVGLFLNPFFEKPAQKGKGKSKASTMNGRSGKNKKKPVLFRVALFADYGVTSCVKSGNPALVEVAEPRQMNFHPYLETSSKPVNSLLVGAKFAILFQLNEIKPDKPLPSYFDIYIADAETSQPIPASLSIYEHAKKKTYTKSASKGHVKYRAKSGDYTFTASNEQYFPATQEATMDGDGITDTLRFALQPKPQPVIIDTPIVSIPVKVGTKVVLHNLFFATNKTQILPESEKALDELYAFLNSHPALVIRITGHTDNVGSDQANLILSEGRANAVRDELIKRGVQPERIEAEGKGESEPIADNATEEGRAKNRRVEFTILSTGDEDIEQIKEE